MSKRTLVLGASLKVDRYSNYVINKLVRNNHEVIAIGIKEGEVAGIKIQTNTNGIADIDTVTLYLNPHRQKPYYDYIITLNPKRVIFNPGTENPEFCQMLRERNIEVEIACTLVLLSTNQY
ncbi:CoA-binding protein [Aquimarina mytili]|uniref:CoA-binding protein n=1 Tax=Aquimarina mytili TaxID=874423 RepID=A0A936ZRL3_9FLAO|nr:CoA-binding protein [Aquimarina mytili]MBL0684122.1 CoA-binding protein [Aquimarina mytili]